jgi:DNA-binding NarL/FixJ family response regulator
MRLAIQDRRRLFREGLSLLLDGEPDIDVVAAAATPGDLIEAVDREHPHIALLQADGSTAETSRTAAALRRRHRRLRIVGVYTTMERHHATEITRAGVDILVAAGGGVDPLLHAVRNGAARTDVSWLEPANSPGTERLAPLTEREREVLRLVGTGHTTREISVRLGISAKTVENHKHRIFAKLGVHNQAHAVSIAMRAGVLTPGTVAASSRAAGQ